MTEIVPAANLNADCRCCGLQKTSPSIVVIGNRASRWKFGTKYGFIDRTGKAVIPPKFDLTFEFSEGLAAASVNGKWGYIDKTGEMVITPREYNHVDSFKNGLAYVVTKDGKHGYIDRTGKYVWQPALQGSD